MITLYTEREGRWSAETAEAGRGFALPEGAAWVDLFTPSEEEKWLVGKVLGIDIPTRAEMQEIEVSSRLYQEDGAYFMTANILTRIEQDHIDSSAITFILAGQRLVTVRYSEPRPFQAYPARLMRSSSQCSSSPDILLGLLETIIDRLADILEMSAGAVNDISRRVFRPAEPQGVPEPHLQGLLIDIGVEGDHVSKIRESLVSISRMSMFLTQAVSGYTTCADFRERLLSLARDVTSLADHATFVANKITFLLDATLGMLSIAQNNIIKIFSVAAVVFLPPTLIASIYGMNFRHMPELAHEYGYFGAIGLMIVSAIMPYLYFKRKKWL